MVQAKKQFGQHWLASRRLAGDLVALIPLDAGATVIEIGPGTGLLTAALLDAGARVTAIEVDPRCADELEATLADRPLRVLRADIRTVRDADLPWAEGPVHLVGNLPYNLSGPILRWTSGRRHQLLDAHFMLQREVADRITAAPGSRTYGALSVQMQWHFAAEIVKKLSPGAFRPPPKVSSAFLRLTPRTREVTPRAEELVRAGFSQRRKMLSSSLAASGLAADSVRAALEAIGQRGDARPEALSPEQWLEFEARLESPS